MVLKLPFTRAASTKGLQRNNGFCVTFPVDGDDGKDDGLVPSGGNVADVGVGERLGPRGARLLLRL